MSVPYTDYAWIVPNLIAQGAYPGAHPGLFQVFDVIVYMAEEKQPTVRTPPGKLALYGPMDDDVYRPVPTSIGNELHVLAQQCARHAAQGRKLLITCAMGKNRSGLMVGLTLLKLYPSWTPEQAIALIRRNRKLPDGDIALSNSMFEQYLRAHGRR